MPRWVGFIVCVAILLVMGRPAAAFPERVELIGKVHSYTPEQVNIITVAHDPWICKFKDYTHIGYKAVGGEELIRPGLAIRFKAVLSERLEAEEPIKSLTVFTPKDFFQPLIELSNNDATADVEEGADGKPADDEPKRKDGKQSEPKEQKDEDDEADKESEKSETEEAAEQLSASGKPMHDVIGVVISCRKGKLMVDCGEAGRVRGELAEGAAVRLELVGMSALQAAKPGDKVHIEGYVDTPGTANAKLVEIVPVAPDKPAKKPAKPRRPRRPAGEEADNGEPADDEPGFRD